METRAHHLAVGIFVLILLTLLAGFVVWLSRTEFRESMQKYVIYFKGSVTGLQIGSPVRYQGVGVGSVTDISIDPENTERVRVVIDIPKSTPVKVDSVASLELQGITGFVYVQIRSGSKDSPLLKAEGKKLPVISSRPSGVEAVFAAAPELLQNLIDVTKEAKALFEPKNIENIRISVENIRIVSEKLAQSSGDIQTVITKTNNLIDTVQAQAEPIGNNIQTLTASLKKNSEQFSALISDNKEAIHIFANTGLYQATLLMSELRELVSKMTRIAANFEKEPGKVLFGTKEQGVKVK